MWESVVDPYPVISVNPASAETTEQMGSKEKFWYRDPVRGRTLFKEVRPDTGEDWAEKVAEQLCILLGLPHAHYELAVSNGIRGVISPTFVGRGEGLSHG